ncbi:hypothetical protein CVT24_002626 [Panaeolus cyanescens]|uniref:DUF3533 domain-containing protein n=1 Tax=Panaeolus cyanescens TaxID=181874 RepID=A0A409YU33_9AGAR|nr:hypothetical protein CVT24_002626 [Panaeolus cyanescens]
MSSDTPRRSSHNTLASVDQDSKSLECKTLTTSTSLTAASLAVPPSSSPSQPKIAPPIPPVKYSKRFRAKNDPDVARARAIYFRAYASGMGLVILSIFAIFTIYWGSLWKVPAHSLQGWVVDFDGGEVGQYVVSELSAINNPVMHWNVVSSDVFGDVEGVIDALRDDKSWAAVIINPGASARLADSIASPNDAYQGTDAISVYAVEARNEQAYRNFIRPAAQASLEVIKAKFTIMLAGRLASAGNLGSILSTSPQTLVEPLGYRLVNIIPFNQPVASAVAFVGLIYLLILAFFIVMIAHGAREASGINRMLGCGSLIRVRLVSCLVGYFFLSFFYSLLNLAFKLDLTRRYGHGGFLVFWMLNWIGMLAVGMALESMITILTPRYIPFFMLLWIITNVSVCVFPIDMLPKIYRYGYAVPFYNISNSIRSIAFGTKDTRSYHFRHYIQITADYHNPVGLNFGVLFAWVLLSCITLPLLQWYVRRRDDRTETVNTLPVINPKESA